LPITEPRRGTRLPFDCPFVSKLDNKPLLAAALLSLSLSLTHTHTHTHTHGSFTVRVGELRQSLIDSIVGMALDFRISAIRLQSKDPLFNSIRHTF